MSNWDWVYELYDRLVEAREHAVADALFNLPGHANAGKFDAVEAMTPVLIGYAKEKRLPWLEVFARHWRLQAYVANNASNFNEMLPEAVSLVAMTARDDVRDCPQSRCAVQDLSLCFGGVDGPGYAAERLKAVTETVARLEPGADCSACMMSETLACLNSMGRHEEAYEHGVAWLDRARENGELGQSFWTDQAADLFEAALRVGQLKEARKIIMRAKPDRAERRDFKALSIARLEIACGDFAAAAAAFPPPKKVKTTTWLRRAWLETALKLVEAGVLDNDSALGGAAATVVRRCETNGQLRDGFDAAIDAASLAIMRGRWGAAKLRVDDAEMMRPKLRGDHGADAKLAALHRRFAALVPGAIGDAADPERRLDAALDEKSLPKVEAALKKLAEPPERAAPLVAAYGK